MMEYYQINKKYLAFAIGFLGFQYYVFNREDGSKIYSFEDTENFRRALTKLTELKKEFEWNFEYENTRNK